MQKALGLQTIHPRSHFNSSEPHPEHKKFPYLLKGLKIDHPNQVWSTDITYTGVDGHWAFVIGIVDWFSRKLMAYNVVNTMDAFHCVETLRMAIERFGKPEIFNPDQAANLQVMSSSKNCRIMEFKSVWTGADAAAIMQNWSVSGER